MEDETIDHIQKFFEVFAKQPHKRRYLSLLPTRDGLKKIRFRYFHYLYLEDSKTLRLSPPQGTSFAAFLYDELKRRGAPEVCVVLSEMLEAENCLTYMDLSSAVKLSFEDSWPIIISCISGRLAYYQSDDAFMQLLCVENQEK